MNTRLVFKVFLCFVVFFALSLNVSAQAIEFSLDDNPSPPGPWGPGAIPNPPYMSAEDEFGLGLPAALAGLLGPSPWLVTGPFWGSDALMPGPIVSMTFAPPPPEPNAPADVDSFSANHFPQIPIPPRRAVPGNSRLRFSVDRGTSGVAGSGVQAEAMLNQQPGDIYDSLFAGNNWLVYDDSFFGLFTGGFGIINPPGVMCPPITPGRYDNIDAYNEFINPLNSTEYYFTMPPGTTTILATWTRPADIFWLPAGAILMWPAPIYATANMMGLDSFGFGTDSIDALVVWDQGVPGVCDPGLDVAIFSLAPGSATLGLGNNGATIFWTNFTGGYNVFATSAQLGLVAAPSINVDAMDYK